MNCVNCGNQMVDAFTAFTVLRENWVYVTEDVPCLECPVCEHVAFSQAVARKLERYSSGRVPPASTYRAWVFKWGEPIVEIPKFTFLASINERIDLENPAGTNGVLVS